MCVHVNMMFDFNIPEISCAFHCFYVPECLCVCIFVCVVLQSAVILPSKQHIEVVLKKVRKTVVCVCVCQRYSAEGASLSTLIFLNLAYSQANRCITRI